MLIAAAATGDHIIDERWGTRIASWGYATLSVDSFGPRGIKNLRAQPPNDFAPTPTGP
jgi:hypothetical protein